MCFETMMSSRSSTPDSSASVLEEVRKTVSGMEMALMEARLSPPHGDVISSLSDAFSWARDELPASLVTLLKDMKTKQDVIRIFQDRDWSEPAKLVRCNKRGLLEILSSFPAMEAISP